MASKNSSEKAFRAAALLSLGALVLVFGCDKHSSPVSPRGQGKGKLELTFHFPKGMAGMGSPLRAMVSGEDFGQIEGTAVPVATYVATSYPYGSISTAQVSMEVPIGTNRHVMVGYYDSFGNNQYGYSSMDVVAGVNNLNMTMQQTYGVYSDDYYYGRFIDLDLMTTSMTLQPGVTDLEMVEVYDGNFYNWDLRDPSGLNSSSTIRYLGNKPEIPFYGMPPAPTSSSSYKGTLWNYPTNDGAKGGASGFVALDDVYLVKTTTGKLAWIHPNSVYAIGVYYDYASFDVVFGCDASGLPTSFTACP